MWRAAVVTRNMTAAAARMAPPNRITVSMASRIRAFLDVIAQDRLQTQHRPAASELRHAVALSEGAALAEIAIHLFAARRNERDAGPCCHRRQANRARSTSWPAAGVAVCRKAAPRAADEDSMAARRRTRPPKWRWH